MERNDRDRYYRGGYNNENRNDSDYDNNRNSYDRDNRYDYDPNNRYDRNDRPGRELKQEFERDYRRQRNDRYSDNDRFSGSDRTSDYRNRDYDMERNYYENTRGNRGELGDIRQGYGMSGFTGTSDRYDTMNDMERNRSAQNELGYGSGTIGGYSGSRYGGSNYSAHGDFGGSSNYGSMSGSGGDMDDLSNSSGYGSSSTSYSDRGQPDYTARNFENRYGAGAGSTYGESAGNTRGYGSGNTERNSYGTSYSGNAEGYGSGSSDNTGYSGRTILDEDRYSANSDRGGYVNSDRNRDY
ncbi:hypothetical protein [Pontibacter pamirensis]|uniref:hypothetical protein n=1 Tax=Pontibacter pamirensis TaxID=2562824 RepID=UPI00138A17D6|nr:hypothetical protein [Pontibacter pamirensis]